MVKLPRISITCLPVEGLTRTFMSVLRRRALDHRYQYWPLQQRLSHLLKLSFCFATCINPEIATDLTLQTSSTFRDKAVVPRNARISSKKSTPLHGSVATHDAHMEWEACNVSTPSHDTTLSATSNELCKWTWELRLLFLLHHII